jgi:predicted Zn-dependent protease
MTLTQVGVTAAHKGRARKDLRQPRGLRHENLEQRLVMYGLSGYQWTNTNVSVSYLPDGTSSEGYSSSLFAQLDAVAPRATWQREFARALQTWANVTNLNFRFVSDSGAASGISGSAQGDSRFGDIRLGAHNLAGPLAYAYYPSNWSTLGGDITMASEKVFSVGSSRDIYSVLLHEVGHAIGLDHSVSGTVMYAYITGVYSGLTADDIAGAQAIYGARQQDSFDAVASNDSFATATVLSVGSSGSKSTSADLTSMADVDYYRVTAPTGTDGSLRVTLDARGKSLLAPKLSVYDSNGNFVTAADAGGNYGSHVTVELAGLVAGQSYYLVADGATNDAFGMGAYQINVEFGVTGGTEPPPEEPNPTPTGPTADRYESNDTFGGATNLGKFNSTGQTGLSVHTSTDRDFFKFSVAKAGTFNVSTIFSHAAGNLDLEIYNSQQQLIAGANSTTNNESITLNLSANTTYFIRVFSPSGATNTYDLAVSKAGGTGGGGKGGRAGDGTAGHPTFESEAEELAYHQHDVRHRDVDAGELPGASQIALLAIASSQPSLFQVAESVTKPQAARPAAPVADLSLVALTKGTSLRHDNSHWTSLAADLTAARSGHSSTGDRQPGQNGGFSPAAASHDAAIEQLDEITWAP